MSKPGRRVLATPRQMILPGNRVAGERLRAIPTAKASSPACHRSSVPQQGRRKASGVASGEARCGDRGGLMTNPWV